MLLAVFERNHECMDALYSCNKKGYKPDLNILNLNGRSCLMCVYVYMFLKCFL